MKILENLNFVALDFETANHLRTSACSIGLAVVEKGKVVETLHRLIRPVPFSFYPGNIAIHGITPRMVEREPEFGSIWNELKPYFEGRQIVAHNASFDLSVLRSLFDHFNIPYPDLEYFCTVMAAKRVIKDSFNHKLSTLSQYFDIELNHHNAESDAIAAAYIAIGLCRKTGSNTLNELSEYIEYNIGKFNNGAVDKFAAIKKTVKKTKKNVA